MNICGYNEITNVILATGFGGGLPNPLSLVVVFGIVSIIIFIANKITKFKNENSTCTEAEQWQKALDTNKLYDYELYVQYFPDGQYSEIAQEKINELKNLNN